MGRRLVPAVSFNAALSLSVLLHAWTHTPEMCVLARKQPSLCHARLAFTSTYPLHFSHPFYTIRAIHQPPHGEKPKYLQQLSMVLNKTTVGLKDWMAGGVGGCSSEHCYINSSLMHGGIECGRGLGVADMSLQKTDKYSVSQLKLISFLIDSRRLSRGPYTRLFTHLKESCTSYGI